MVRVRVRVEGKVYFNSEYSSEFKDEDEINSESSKDL